MATHSSILAWRIPLTEEPGGLQCMGLKGSGTTAATTVNCYSAAGTILSASLATSAVGYLLRS